MMGIFLPAVRTYMYDKRKSDLCVQHHNLHTCMSCVVNLLRGARRRSIIFKLLLHVSDRIVKGDILRFLVKSPASSGIPQEGVDFPGVQFLGATSRQKPSYRHPRARVPMLSMVEYSCTVQLFRTAVLCHVINRSVTSYDTSS